MSEINENPNLNEDFTEEEMEDPQVMTVPIDETLTQSGEAADAAAVGAALALKMDKSSAVTISVNGQTPDNQGLILVTGADTKIGSTDQRTVEEGIAAAAARTGADIPLNATPGAPTIAEAMSAGSARTAEQIPMSAADQTSVKDAIDGAKAGLATLDTAVAGLNARTAEGIRYKAGSAETISQHVDALGQGIVKTVNETGPDANGNVALDYVPFADNFRTEDVEQVDDTFLIRLTGKDVSVQGEKAYPMSLKGNRNHAGYVPEVLNLSVMPMPRPVPPDITATLDESTFEAYVQQAGTYSITFTTSWSADPALYGLTITNDPVNGDQITMVWDGLSDADLTVSPAPRQAPPAIQADIDRATFVAYVLQSATITLTYTTGWNSDPELYGITVENDPVAGDQISVTYVKEERGIITPAAPAFLKSSGWNLYNHAAGYARVLKYSESRGYIIGGTFTAAAFGLTPDAASPTPIVPDEDGLFTIPSDGYVIVTGGDSVSTYVTPTWTDWTEGPTVPFEPYSESVLHLFDEHTDLEEQLPYGLCRVGEVRDEIDFGSMQTVRRIDRVDYTEEARAAAAASGRPYEFDLEYIYIARETEIVTAIELDDAYKCNDHGLEWFDGTVAVNTQILYGQNLKDKLRRDVVTVRQQTWTDTEKAQARNNIGAMGTGAVLKSASAVPIPSAGSSVTKQMEGLTADHELVRWNFSASAENNPPVSLTWTTADGSFTITNTAGSTSETIKPVFAKPTAIAVN